MDLLYPVGRIVSSLISLYLFILFLRVILDWARFFVPNGRPPGVVMVVANAIYALTDPPLRALSRWIPPARIGQVSLDVGFLVLFLGLLLARRLMWAVISLVTL